MPARPGLLREPAFVVTLVIAVVVALGFGLGPVFQKAGEGSYLQFVAPGVVAMTVLFSSAVPLIRSKWKGSLTWMRSFRCCVTPAPLPRPT